MEILRKIRENKKIVFINIIILLVAVFIILFIFKAKSILKERGIKPTEKPIILQENETSSSSNQEEESIYSLALARGQLMEISETTIKILDFEKVKNNETSENIEENMETYNIDDSTPVTRGLNGKVKSALHELKLGQLITVEYNKKTKNVIAITININKK